MVDRQSTKLHTKTRKMMITWLLLQNCVFERKLGFDKMGTFDQNPCLVGENGYPFYQEHTVRGRHRSFLTWSISDCIQKYLNCMKNGEGDTWSRRHLGEVPSISTWDFREISDCPLSRKAQGELRRGVPGHAGTSTGPRSVFIFNPPN